MRPHSDRRTLAGRPRESLQGTDAAAKNVSFDVWDLRGPLKALLEPSGGFLRASRDSPRCFLRAQRGPRGGGQIPEKNHIRSNCTSGICLIFLVPLSALLEPSGGFLRASQASPRCFLSALRRQNKYRTIPDAQTVSLGFVCDFVGRLKALLEPSGGSLRPSRDNPPCFLRAQRGPGRAPPIPEKCQTLKLQIGHLSGIWGALLEPSWSLLGAF